MGGGVPSPAMPRTSTAVRPIQSTIWRRKPALAGPRQASGSSLTRTATKSHFESPSPRYVERFYGRRSSAATVATATPATALQSPRGTLTLDVSSAPAVEWSMIRTVRPTDLVPLLRFAARPTARDILRSEGDRDQLSIGQVVQQALTYRPGRECWVDLTDGRPVGLITARVRAGTDTWEIDRCIVDEPHGGEASCVRLIGHVVGAAIDEGAMKLFARLPSASPWVAPLRNAGFSTYAAETEYLFSDPADVPALHLPGLRARRPVDHHALFQLYCSAVPLRVREFEGMTLQEWRWLDGWGLMAPVRPVLPGSRRDYVLNRADQIDGWLQVTPRRRSLRALFDGLDVAEIEACLQFAFSELGDEGRTTMAVRSYQIEIGSALERWGFIPGIPHDLLGRLLPIRVPERRFVPARVT